MFKDTYAKMNDKINPSASLINKTLKAENKTKRRLTPIAVFKPAAVMLAAVICVFAVTPALSANVPMVHQMLYNISPATAQFFMPVNKSSVDNGIKMEVASVSVDNDTVWVYITMQDLEGDRIDQTVDLYDSGSIYTPYDSTGHCELVGYDDKTKTAEFLITTTNWNGKSFSGDKMTFSVSEFLSDKREIEAEIDINLANAETQKANITGVGDNWQGNRVLVPNEERAINGTDKIAVTAMGYVDSKLHVQLKYTDRLKNDNHGFLYMLDENGNKLSCDGMAYFNLNDESYIEYVFSVPQSDIGKYTLHGEFVISNNRTEGNWRVTIPVETNGTSGEITIE